MQHKSNSENWAMRNSSGCWGGGGGGGGGGLNSNSCAYIRTTFINIGRRKAWAHHCNFTREEMNKLLIAPPSTFNSHSHPTPLLCNCFTLQFYIFIALWSVSSVIFKCIIFLCGNTRHIGNIFSQSSVKTKFGHFTPHFISR